MKKSLLFPVLLGSVFVYSQTEVIFEYDESGNQIYRGKREHSSSSSNPYTPSNFPSNGTTMSPEEIAFWREVKLAPVPVHDFLTIEISQEVKNKLHNIVVYDALGNPVYSIQNTSQMPLRREENLSYLSVGEYTFQFNLTDGKSYTQKILKH